MKRTKWPHLLWTIAVAGVLLSCNDGNGGPSEEAFQPTLAESLSTVYSNKTYPTDSLVLYYTSSSVPLLGRDVKFETEDLKTGTLTLYNVVPGEAETVLSGLTLKEATDAPDKLTFSYKTVTTETGVRLTLASKSNVRPGRLELIFSSVTFPANRFSKNTEGKGWWALRPYDDQTSAGSIYLDWRLTPGTYTFTDEETGETETVEVTPENAGDPISLALGPILGGMMKGIVQQLIPNILGHINFSTNGNIQARYNANGLSGDAAWQVSPANNLCFFYTKDDRLYVIPNIEMIVRQIKANQAASRSSIGTDDIQAILTRLSVWITQGAPFRIEDNADGSTTVYLETEQLEPLLVLLPMLTSLLPEDMQSLAPMLGKLTRLGAVTEHFELGLTLVPSQQPAE